MYSILNLNYKNLGPGPRKYFQTQDSDQKKNIGSWLYSTKSQILILKKYGQDLRSIFQQVQTQGSGQKNIIEPWSHDLQSQILILKT